MIESVIGPFNEVEKDAPYLSESEAWREIARRIEDGEWDGQGLCREMEDLYDGGHITGATECDMRDRLEGELDGRVWLFPIGEAKRRLDLCMRFAAECAE